MRVQGADVFFLIKLLLLPLWLPFKILWEIIEHSGRSRHYRRRHRPRVIWLPGRAGLSAWTSQVMRITSGADRTPVQRFIVTPLAILTVFLAWGLLAYAWLLWWVLLAIALPLALIF